MSVCRTCLSKEELQPIFPVTSNASSWSKQLYLVTGVQIELNDGLTQLICESCDKLIKAAIKLREQSLKSEKILKQISLNATKNDSNYTVKIEPVNIDYKTIDIDTFDTNSSDTNLEIPNKQTEAERDENEKTKSKFKINLDSSSYEYSVAIEDFESSNDEDLMNEACSVDLDQIDNYGKSVRIEDYESSNSIDLDDSDDDIDCDEELVENKTVMKDMENTKFLKHEKEVVEREKRKIKAKELECKLMSLAVAPYDKNGPVKCKICDRVVRNVQNFKCHAKTHFELENSCEECGKKFVNRSHMRYHQQRVHGRTKRLACRQCPYRAVDLQTLQNHERAEHTGERPYICDVCGDSFRMRANIAQHLRKHFGVRNLQCDRCPAMFRSRSELTSHQNKVHFMLYTYFCYLCTETYRSPGSVRKHLANVHGVPQAQQLQIKCIRTRKKIIMPLTAAEKMRRYRERLKNEHPEKYEEQRKKNLERIKSKKKKVSVMTSEEKEVQRQNWRRYQNKFRKKKRGLDQQ